jgi:hypothetical protein
MAHADYDCCAICDSKMNYNSGAADTKEALCIDCIERTAELGTPCTRPSQVQEHLKSLSDEAALKWLHDVGFSPCYYPNDIDLYLIDRGLIETGIKDAGKWGKRLRAA